MAGKPYAPSLSQLSFATAFFWRIDDQQWNDFDNVNEPKKRSWHYCEK
jgi:hypothetical protein